MNSFLKLTLIDLKLYLRNSVATFFTLAFPLLMLAIYGGIYGNEPVAMFGNRGTVDISVPGYIATIIIGTAAFMSLPVDLAMQRQLGVLRRLRGTPVHPAAILAARLVTHILVALFGTAVLILQGTLIFGASLPANGLGVFLGFLLCSTSMFALGFALSSLVRSANAVRAVSFMIFFPMMFFSGGSVPGQLLPEGIKLAGKLMPMTYSVRLMQELWFGNGWDIPAALALLACLVVGGIVALRFFRWE